MERGKGMTWADAVLNPAQDKNVAEALIPANGGRVHVSTPVDAPRAPEMYVITNTGPDPLPVAIWVNPRQPHVQVWDPQGKHGESIEVTFTGDGMHAARGRLEVARQMRPA